MRVAQKVMPHIFFSETMYSECMKLSHSITGCFFTHVFFPHNLHLCLRPYASAKQGHACLPCTSLFRVHIAMSLLHESCCRHLQTLSHAVYPSVAQKDENLTVPDQDYRGDWGAQSNQIWQLPPGFIDLCEGGHCRAESTCLLDSY